MPLRQELNGQSRSLVSSFLFTIQQQPPDPQHIWLNHRWYTLYVDDKPVAILGGYTMENNDATPSPAPDTTQQPENAYEQMCISLYAYRYGALGFLELLSKFEERLGLPSPQSEPHVTLE
jgi:hypothetical protein